ncbi:MAG: hypothetical protein JSS12_06760 [Verrucomicrobia bacterium]|nr:hypothetical protein [Verrucomicrobiota bacterium]
MNLPAIPPLGPLMPLRASYSPAPTPRTARSLLSSPLNSPKKSPKTTRESTEEEKATANYVKANFPLLYSTLEKGEESRFLTLIEQIFHLHTTIQCNCLPLTNRNICVESFIRSKTQENEELVTKLHQEWKEKETSAIAAATEERELSDREIALINAIRATTFELLYEEQEEITTDDPYLPFYSIFNEFGTRNLGYVDKTHALTESKALATQKQLEGVHDQFHKFLSFRGVEYNSLTEREAWLVEQAQMSSLEAMIAITTQGPCTLHDESVLLMGAVASTPTVQYLQDLVAANIADQKWAHYSNEWGHRFRQKFGSPITSLTKSEQEFVELISPVFYQLIYDEQQAHGLPFVSICDRTGECNRAYWIEKLNAEARAKKEKPFEDYRHLKDYSDLDVVSLNTAPYIPKDGSIRDSTGIRHETGSKIKDFCQSVLISMQQYAETVEKEREIEKLFEDQTTSHTDLLHYIQNQFCQSLATIHYLRGLTHTLSKKLNTSYVPTSPRLLATPRKAKESDPLDAACEGFLTEIQKVQEIAGKKFPVNEDIDPYFTSYAATVVHMTRELEKLGLTLKLFATRLTEATPTKRKKPGSYRARSLSKPQNPQEIQESQRTTAETAVQDGLKAKSFIEMSMRIEKVTSILKKTADLLSVEAGTRALEGLSL